MFDKSQIQELIAGKKQEMSLSDKLLRKVKEVKAVNDFKEVNKLVKQNWIVLAVIPVEDGQYSFSLGRIETNRID